MSKERKMKTDPFTATQEAANVGTDVSVGPGETIPEADGKRRPGSFAQEPERPPAPGVTPGSNPDNPGDDPGVATPQQQPDVTATDPSVPPTESAEQGERD
jgi:hypothetical protein